MNYLHAFHAGNFADVFKHVVLTGLLEVLKTKPSPFSYLETHAGAGCYDLRVEHAERTQEYQAGIMRLLDCTAQSSFLGTYLNLIRSLNPTSATLHDITLYPGSPLLASKLLRDTDRAQLCELQSDEAAKLKMLFSGDSRVQVHTRDGYSALKALLPPKPPRGLVLIDPPFEAQEEEFRIIESALEIAHARWPTGIYVIWYPIKLRQTIKPFHRWLKFSGLKKILIAELLVHPDNSGLRLNGCGMAIANAPYQFDRMLAPILSTLTQHLAQSRFGQHKLEWLESIGGQ